MNILKELWYGNIQTNELSNKKGSEYSKALHDLVEKEELLLPTLSPELQTAIEQLLDIQMEAAAIAERDAFITGFRLATQLLVAGSGHPPVISD